jgi:hypothetical protein
MAQRPKDKEEVPIFPSIRITPGELLDRLAILTVKSERIKDARKRESAQEQQIDLGGLRAKHKIPLGDNFNELCYVHELLWETEDRLRKFERFQYFGKLFVRAARDVYHLNDIRSGIKRRIDDELGYEPEVKEYAPYGDKTKESSA